MSLTKDEQVVMMYAQQLQPVWYCNRILGQFLWSKQREIIESVRDNQRTAVRSGHGIGKTRIAAKTAVWFLESFANSRVITTAPTWNQVENLLWREIGAVWSSSPIPLMGKKLNTRIEIDSDWFAIGLSTDEPERFSGQHSAHVLLIVDEGSGVSDDIYEAGEGYLTTAGSRMLMIGNPTQNSGQFYNAFHRERNLWNTIHMSVFDSPAFTGEKVPDSVLSKLTTEAWVEDKKLKWGEQSPIYQVRVLGDFATTSDNTVFSLSDIDSAQDFVYEPTLVDPAVVACDVARFGSDETVISIRQGNHVRIAETYVGNPTTHTAGRIIHYAKRVRSELFPEIVVDDDGVGGGVTDILVEQGYSVIPFHGGASAIESNEYPNARSELWFSVSDICKKLDLDTDDQLAADLSAVEYTMDSKGRRVVEPKDILKKRIGRSPDRGDSVLLCFAPDRSGKVIEGNYLDPDTEPVRKRGDLVLRGEQYVDKEPV